MTTTIHNHDVYCRECGDELGRCQWPGCAKVRTHKSYGTCVWCFQHPATK